MPSNCAAEKGRLALHVVVDAVYHDIISGRIDVLELLRCRDMWFFAEIVSDACLLERRLFQDDAGHAAQKLSILALQDHPMQTAFRHKLGATT